MKKISCLPLAVSLLFLSCWKQEAEPLLFIGKIGEKYMAEISLMKTGQLLEGQFKYIDLNKEPLPLKGTLKEKVLRLEEFDGGEEVTGIFEGNFTGAYYRGQWRDPQSGITVPFDFHIKVSRGDSIRQEVASKNKAKTAKKVTLLKEYNGLNSNALLKGLFPRMDIQNEQFALSKDKTIKTEFDTLLYFKQNKEQYALAFFSNYELDENGEPNLCHICSGEVSIARFIQKNESWQLEKFVANCECGQGTYESTNPPTELFEFNDQYLFLKSKGHDMGQGISMEWIHLFDIKSFKLVANIETAGDNSGAAMGVEDEYAFESKLDFALCDDLPCIDVKYSGTKPNEDYTEILNLEGLSISYIYDENSGQFIVKK